MIHSKSRAKYPGAKRFAVADDEVPWETAFEAYSPVDYTAPVVLGDPRPVWADVDVRKDQSVSLQYNSVDGKVDRRSFTGKYDIVDGVPRNPKGRTGMVGRGLLGRWGPNHAADPIVTRWLRSREGERVERDGRPVLEFVAIQRRDTDEWALPGGMVDPGDNVSETLKKEFGEESMGSLGLSAEKRAELEKNIGVLFQSGQQVFAGYVDDPRNTDNAWMETTAVNFHDDSGDTLGKFQLKAGDDAKAVRWQEIDHKSPLYASHSHFIKQAAKLRNAYF